MTSLMILWIFFCVAVVIIVVAGRWKVYEKAGQEGWKCIIPIYNTYILLKIVGKPGWWLLLFLIPGVNIVFAIWMLNMLSKSFDKDEGFTVGLFFLSFIFIPILGFGDATYQGPYGDAEQYAEYQRQHQFDFEN
jgi:hypothetical protein